MAYNISIYFRDNSKAVFQNVEKVETLPVGRGILSVIKDGKNKCFLMDIIDFYEIEQAEIQPEIIHCKDCRYYKAYDYTGKLACHYVIGATVEKKPDDFCKLGLKIGPSAEPEIIHCKDCKRYGKDNCFIKIQMLWELKPDDFCSMAERKE